MIQRVELAKQAADYVSVGVTIGTIAQIIPAVAGIMSTIWFMIRIWESDTVQKWRKKRRKK